MDSTSLRIIGASTRAAAQSAARAGFAVYSADLFADRDHPPTLETHRTIDYPAGLFAALRQFPPGRWLYTGGLEDYPQRIDRAARRGKLLGVAGPGLRAVRDPIRLGEVVRSAGVAFPQTTPRLSEAGPDWLQKCLPSSGGHGVRWMNGAMNPEPTSTSRVYYQQYIAGTPQAAVFVGDGNETNGQGAELLGVTQQLVGPTWGAAEFHYAGSIGPVPISQGRRRALETLGAAVASAFNLVGLFGIDLVETEAGPVAIEVNPRYPASAEVLERASGQSAIARHVAACCARQFPPVGAFCSDSVCGKLVLFARRPCQAGTAFCQFVDQQNAQDTRFADLPRPGEVFRPGQPVITALATADSQHEAARQLQQRLAQPTDLLEDA